MSRLKVHCFSMSLDGFGAGPNQSLQNPLGERGGELHQWFRGTRTFQRMLGDETKGTDGPDEDFAARGFENIGAWILGRNMFGRSAAPGPTKNGKAGGATNRPTTATCSC
jgi:dihydrofolate reductase